jgi:dolichyl-phosphate-mannose--protein O-mannosyl transferase
VAFDIGARRNAGAPRIYRSWSLSDLPGWVGSFLVLPVVVYTLSWTGWFVTDQGFDRAGRHGIGGLLAGWLDYHRQIRAFHEGLTANHPYESNNPLEWLILHRPVAFSYDGTKFGQAGCTSPSGCSAEVLDLGNPAIWWTGTVAVVAVFALWLLRRDWRAAVVLVGFAFNFFIWFAFPGRTKFAFYALPLLPFLILALTLLAGVALGPPGAPRARRVGGATAVGAFALVVLATFAFFHPIWVGDRIPTSSWEHRVRFQSWI